MQITRKKGNLCEMRGIMFIREGDSAWKRHLFIGKFFNLNQSSGTDITYMTLIINGKAQKVNINQLYVDAAEKVYRAIDLKVGQTVGLYNRDTEEAGKMFTIETLEKNILPTEVKENSWMYSDLADVEVTRVANKEDGSAIRFFMLNGKLVAKTKFALESEQTEIAMKVVETDDRLKAFILKTLETGLAALFEIVSPLNKIVLSYNETSLRLLQLRVEETGEYLNIYENELVKEFGVLTTAQEDLGGIKEVAGKFTADQLKEKLNGHTFNSINELLEFLK